MKAGILGRKVGMTQIFDATGERVPVTVLEASPNTVIALRTPEADGYAAVQLGFEDKPDRKVNSPERGLFAKAGVTPKRHLREFRVTAEVADRVVVGRGRHRDVPKSVGVVGEAVQRRDAVVAPQAERGIPVRRPNDRPRCDGVRVEGVPRWDVRPERTARIGRVMGRVTGAANRTVTPGS